jgi:hypothetical protein
MIVTCFLPLYRNAGFMGIGSARRHELWGVLLEGIRAHKRKTYGMNDKRHEKNDIWKGEKRKERRKKRSACRKEKESEKAGRGGRTLRQAAYGEGCPGRNLRGNRMQLHGHGKRRP